MNSLPACAGCGSTYKPKHSNDPACPDCHKWNLDTPKKYLAPGFREKNPGMWQARWSEYQNGGYSNG